MIHAVHAYLNCVTLGHILFFVWTFRYVYLMRRKPVDISDIQPNRRQLIHGMFAGAYPDYKQGTLNYHLTLDIRTARGIVCKDGALVFGDTVKVYGKLKGNTFTKITLLSTLDKVAIRKYLMKRFTITHTISLVISAAWEVIQL